MVNNFSFDNIGILANKIISAKQGKQSVNPVS